ncbi:P2X purinoceptor 4-like [Puntigrus tetrazona]|uniref:P2X purinoceptor 4-like n=1 Tax=Puntigrus tetrazona TaxID=1606681 RepID=UPI001C892572|nr:P2X purinoceptor 4-like [Puntigrus tetrazona]
MKGRSENFNSNESNRNEDSRENKELFSEYTTPRKLVVKSWRIGVMYRLYQLIAIPYALLYVAWSGGHQETDTILSSVTTKVKASLITNTTELGEQVWDVADYIIPAQEDGSFFLMTNMVITPNQTQSTCPEYPTPKTICTSDMNCTKGFKDHQGTVRLNLYTK